MGIPLVSALRPNAMSEMFGNTQGIYTSGLLNLIIGGIEDIEGVEPSMLFSMQFKRLDEVELFVCLEIKFAQLKLIEIHCLLSTMAYIRITHTHPGKSCGSGYCLNTWIRIQNLSKIWNERT